MISIEEFEDWGIAAVVAEARPVAGEGATYVSFAPGTGTVEFAGFTSREVNRMLRGLRNLNLVGADVVEVSPPFDPSGAKALAATNLALSSFACSPKWLPTKPRRRGQQP